MAEMTPRPEAHAFLAREGLAAAEVRPLAGDASFRRYFRVVAETGRTLLMDAPPEHEDVGAFVRVAAALRGLGLSAPEVYAEDDEHGFLLIEDFGDDVATPFLRDFPRHEERVYECATDIIARLATSKPGIDLPLYDADALTREVMLFPEWYAKSAGLDVDVAAFRDAFREAWVETVVETRLHPVLTLRDFHADNMMLLKRAGLGMLGLLDFQDALLGHMAYDLVSLLQDARRDLAPDLEEKMLERFMAAAGLQDKLSFRRSYEVLGAQRNVKILGIFVRLRDRDGRSGYVERLPRVWAHLERNLAHPALKPVADWFDRFVPEDKRAGWCVA